MLAVIRLEGQEPSLCLYASQCKEFKQLFYSPEGSSESCSSSYRLPCVIINATYSRQLKCF